MYSQSRSHVTCGHSRGFSVRSASYISAKVLRCRACRLGITPTFVQSVRGVSSMSEQRRHHIEQTIVHDFSNDLTDLTNQHTQPSKSFLMSIMYYTHCRKCTCSVEYPDPDYSASGMTAMATTFTSAGVSLHLGLIKEPSPRPQLIVRKHA